MAAAVATAKFWAADAGHRVAHTAVHVHGGMGIDTSYPVHRYFIAAKRAEFTLGGATAQLLRLGDVLAKRMPKQIALIGGSRTPGRTGCERACDAHRRWDTSPVSPRLAFTIRAGGLSTGTRRPDQNELL